MQGITEYIVQFDHTHNSSVEVEGLELAVNPDMDQPKQINRVGTIVSAPLLGSPQLEVGYEVMVIHTLLLTEIYNNGKNKSFYLVDEEKGLFRFDQNMIVMFRESDKDQWKCHLKNVMVRPIVIKEDQKIWNGIIIPDAAFNDSNEGYKGNVKNKGTIAYGNQNLIENAIFEGDEVIFKQEREYEFEIDGETLWHMENEDLLLYENKFIKSKPQLEDSFI